jgi:hypothetical protein
MGPIQQRHNQVRADKTWSDVYAVSFKDLEQNFKLRLMNPTVELELFVILFICVD